MNQWRSPTAERLYRDHPGLSVLSAGTSPQARRTISAKLLHWADVVIVMEDAHKRYIRQAFPKEAATVSLHVLELPDLYPFMDAELQEELRAVIDPILFEN